MYGACAPEAAIEGFAIGQQLPDSSGADSGELNVRSVFWITAACRADVSRELGGWRKDELKGEFGFWLEWGACELDSAGHHQNRSSGCPRH